MKDRMRRVEVDEADVGERPAHVRLEVRPAGAAKVVTEIVEDDESALEQIRTHARRFAIGHRPKAGFGHVRDRILQELGIIERDGVALVDVRPQRRDLAHDLHQVRLGHAVAMRPRRQAAIVVAAWTRHIPDPSERKSPIVLDIVDIRIKAAPTAPV